MALLSRKWRRRESNPRPQKRRRGIAGGRGFGSSGESDNSRNDSHERPRLDDDPRSQRGPSTETPTTPPVVAGDEPRVPTVARGRPGRPGPRGDRSARRVARAAPAARPSTSDIVHGQRRLQRSGRAGGGAVEQIGDRPRAAAGAPASPLAHSAPKQRRSACMRRRLAPLSSS